MAIHDAALDAVHVHSRFVEIASVPDIPAAGAALAGASSTLTWHFAAVGDVTEIDDDEPVQEQRRTESRAIGNSRARMARVDGASALPDGGSDLDFRARAACDRRR